MGRFQEQCKWVNEFEVGIRKLENCGEIAVNNYEERLQGSTAVTLQW